MKSHMLHHLNEDVLSHILGLLNVPNRAKTRLVCKTFRRVVAILYKGKDVLAIQREWWGTQFPRQATWVPRPSSGPGYGASKLVYFCPKDYDVMIYRKTASDPIMMIMIFSVTCALKYFLVPCECSYQLIFISYVYHYGVDDVVDIHIMPGEKTMCLRRELYGQRIAVLPNGDDWWTLFKEPVFTEAEAVSIAEAAVAAMEKGAQVA
jgi:hypothetical protein